MSNASAAKSHQSLKIHIISTVNGQVNEGMRNVATHMAKSFEGRNDVRYSGLKRIGSMIKNSCACDVTMIFARANKQVYWLSRLVGMCAKNVWIVCVQKPDAKFTRLTGKHPLRANYLSIVRKDLDEIKPRSNCRKELFTVGIDTDKFRPVDKARQAELKVKYGMDHTKPLVIHVGHCSIGRGLEDFAAITDAQLMVVASGMFEHPGTVKTLENTGVKIHKGYLKKVEEIYQMADAYLFPAHSTDFVISIPLSVMEALSCGVPVVGYKDFENLTCIPAEKGAVTLVNRKENLNSAVMAACCKKQNKSYLTAPMTWEQAADGVIDIVRRS